MTLSWSIHVLSFSAYDISDFLNKVMIHPPAIGGMALIFLMLIVTENHEFIAAHNCDIGGGSGPGQFGRVYSEDFKTAEDCEQQCEYVTGEAEAICKVWQYRLWGFKRKNTKLKRFLAKNQL